MTTSIAVMAGNTATAAEYNTLRDDVVDPTTGHTHTGAAGEGPLLGRTAISHIILDYEAIAANTPTVAQADGVVVATATLGAGLSGIQGIANGVQRAFFGTLVGSYVNLIGSITFCVKKGDTYQVISSSVTAFTCFFHTLGT